MAVEFTDGVDLTDSVEGVACATTTWHATLVQHSGMLRHGKARRAARKCVLSIEEGHLLVGLLAWGDKPHRHFKSDLRRINHSAARSISRAEVESRRSDGSLIRPRGTGHSQKA